MNENDSRSFEIVDLIAPIELAPIQGIESPILDSDTGVKTGQVLEIEAESNKSSQVLERNLVIETKTESNKTSPKLAIEVGGNKTNSVPEILAGNNKSSQIPEKKIESKKTLPMTETKAGGNTKPGSVPEIEYGTIKSNQVPENKAVGVKSNQKHEINYGRDMTNTFHNTAAEQDPRFQNRQQVGNGYYSRNVKVDLNKIFREQEEFQKRVDLEKRKKYVMVVSIIAFLVAFTIALSLVRRSFTGTTIRDTRQESPIVQLLPETNSNDYLNQDDVYGIVKCDSAGVIYSDQLQINEDIIEYTSATQRTLFFRVTPKEDNLAVVISAEMKSKYGISYGIKSTYKRGIPKGETGIVALTFDIYPFQDLNGVTYTLNANTAPVSESGSQKEITDIGPGENSSIMVTVEGDKYVEKVAYAVLYKNENVIKVIECTDGIGKEKATLKFDVNDLDYDYCEIYY